MNTAVVGVGSNIQPQLAIQQAKRLLSEEQRFINESTFVATSPIGFADQPDFINGAFLLSTEMERADFERYLKDLESRLGRVRTGNKNGPRTIDLDIIVWNGLIVNENFYEREFLRNAVLELLPGIKP